VIALDPYAQSLADKATRFFAAETEVFAECGEGVVCYVAKCETEGQAVVVAAVLEGLRRKMAK
jgi:hypothetical protein